MILFFSLYDNGRNSILIWIEKPYVTIQWSSKDTTIQLQINPTGREAYQQCEILDSSFICWWDYFLLFSYFCELQYLAYNDHTLPNIKQHAWNGKPSGIYQVEAKFQRLPESFFERNNIIHHSIILLTNIFIITLSILLAC